ncbi:hypothetical protein KUCAC02_030228 [Chaenocephalus aceratus]|uniref:Uncharacterized protein n=1 Tax=Chaenocephalus aceratus TaxID=36190 RepID=A0ACB9XJF7_CHAAC|nr:hypothetical protein KUCAC02_030228 [Chaenocephalus aceratus]
MSQLVSELEKQRASLRKDMSELIQESVKPLQSSVDPTEFISDLLMGSLGPDVLSKPPELERAHRSLAPRPGPGGRPRPFLICFHHFQEREKVLRWNRQHELKYRDTSLRVYPDVSAITAKKRAAFNKIKQALDQKGVKCRLLFPARLKVSFEDGTFTFETPEDAHAFYVQRAGDGQRVGGSMVFLAATLY